MNNLPNHLAVSKSPLPLAFDCYSSIAKSNWNKILWYGSLLPIKWSPKGPLSHENKSLKGPLRVLLTFPYIIGIAENVVEKNVKKKWSLTLLPVYCLLIATDWNAAARVDYWLNLSKTLLLSDNRSWYCVQSSCGGRGRDVIQRILWRCQVSVIGW